MAFDAEEPAFIALANASQIEPERMAAAFNEPAEFFEHVTLEELERLTECCGRFAALLPAMTEAMSGYTLYAKGLLAGLKNAV